MIDKLQLEPTNYKINNLNFIRLFAAFQVILDHLGHLFKMPDCIKYVHMFNGVPIFFVISGFLIFWSYDNNPNNKDYASNRFLRIFPALFISFIVTVILLLSFGIITFSDMKTSGFLLWIITQLTFIQQFAPSVVHGFGGLGAPNPALWTISIEILLYLHIPLIYHLIDKCSKKRKVLIIICIGVISYFENSTRFVYTLFESFSENGYYRILLIPFMEFLSYLFYFCFGILVYLHKEKIIPFLKDKCLFFLPVYVIYSIIIFHFNCVAGAYHPNLIELVGHGLLVFCIFSIAYTKPYLTSKILGKTDISYGLYIYHFLVISSFNELGWNSHWFILPLFAICFLLGYLSWIFVEKPALKLKKKPLYKI